MTGTTKTAGAVKTAGVAKTADAKGMKGPRQQSILGRGAKHPLIPVYYKDSIYSLDNKYCVGQWCGQARRVKFVG